MVEKNPKNTGESTTFQPTHELFGWFPRLEEEDRQALADMLDEVIKESGLQRYFPHLTEKIPPESNETV